MTTLSSYDAIHDYVTEMWNWPELIVWENGGARLPDAPEPFVLIEIVGNVFRQETFGDPGNNLWREVGTVFFHVMVEKNTGSRGARDIATRIAALFKETGPEGIRVIDLSLGAGDPGEKDGNYWRMTVTLDFEHDE